MEYFQIVFGSVPTWLRFGVAAGVLLALAIPKIRALWADLIYGERWWTAAKRRLEVEKLQIEIAILKSDAASKAVQPIPPLLPPRSERRSLTIDRLFWRQCFAAWLGGMMPLVFFQVIAIAGTLSKEGGLDSAKWPQTILWFLLFTIIVSLQAPFAASEKREARFVDAMREGLGNAIVLLILAAMFLGSKTSPKGP